MFCINKPKLKLYLGAYSLRKWPKKKLHQNNDTNLHGLRSLNRIANDIESGEIF